MVLSNKKLKQKLRAQLLESAATSFEVVKVVQENPITSKSVLDDSVTLKKPRLSKRDKRREKVQNGHKQEESGGTPLSVTSEQKKKGKDKKRKRDQETDKEELKDSEKKPPLKKKNKKKKKYKNKKKQKVEDGQVKDDVNIGNGEVEETVESSKSEERDVPVCSREESGGDISNKVYVGGIPYYSTEDDIRSFFEGCGTITELDCMTFPDTGKFRGIAIISFKTEAAAKRAMALDGSDMGGLFLKIQSYKSARGANKVSNFSPNMVEGYNRVYVGNLSWNVTEDDLKKLFSDCSISSIRFGEDKETGEFRGYAHVDFADSPSVNMALKLDQMIVCGRPVRISCAVAAKKGAVKKGVFTNSRPPKDQNAGSVAASKDQNADSVAASKDQNAGNVAASKYQNADSVATGKDQDAGSVVTSKDQNADSVATSTVSAKIRRRTCYECGERGHLSSSCPKKQETDLTEQVAS